MKLNKNILENKKLLEEKGYKYFSYDREEMIKNTIENPTWLHFGAGNIFRAFLANCKERLLNDKIDTTGIIVCETYDEQIIDKVFTPYDDLFINVSLKSSGQIEKNIVGSIAQSFKYTNNYNNLKEIICKKSLEIITLTVTEKAYSYLDKDGNVLSYIKDDLDNFNIPTVTINIITKLLYERFKANKNKLTVISADNCSHNGTILYEAVDFVANEWCKTGLVEKEFIAYLKQDISFTWSMIDKITPRPSEAVLNTIKEDGFSNVDVVVTNKNSYTSAFVNAESFELFAVEDNFVNGKPNLNKVDVLYLERDVIDRIEKMKVCTCLNPLHTVLSIFGCLLSFDLISKEMKDKDLVELVKQVGYVESLPVVVDPKVINAKEFIDTCLNDRFCNPFLEDSPWRIVSDTSKKLPIRFGETLKAYIEEGKTDLSFIKCIPFVFAGWVRYLMGINDDLEKYTVSPDPNYNEFYELVKDIKIGEENDLSNLKKIFSREDIFGINLYDYNLGDVCENHFKNLIKEKGSVRKEIKKIIKG